jgi:hypothetical protein
MILRYAAGKSSLVDVDQRFADSIYNKDQVSCFLIDAAIFGSAAIYVDDLHQVTLELDQLYMDMIYSDLYTVDELQIVHETKSKIKKMTLAKKTLH